MNLNCSKTTQNNTPTWGVVDLLIWKLVPSGFNGSRGYIQRYKDAWVTHNKATIKIAALQQQLPIELLAGICWIEVGGDPNFIDRVAFEIRSLDWSGPSWIDRTLTITSPPEKTSFGAVSIQLRVAAETLGLDINTMSSVRLLNLANCLQHDVINIRIVARHLRSLINHDAFQRSLPHLTEEQIRIVGARYNRGTGLPLEKIKKNTSYGDFIVKQWPRFSRLVR